MGRVRPSLLRPCRRSTDPQRTAEGVKRTEQTSAAAAQLAVPEEGSARVHGVIHLRTKSQTSVTVPVKGHPGASDGRF